MYAVKVLKTCEPYFGNIHSSTYGKLKITCNGKAYIRSFDIGKENRYIIDGKKIKLNYEGKHSLVPFFSVEEL